MRSFTIIFILSFSLVQAQEKERILFIGNSFTFYWNLPNQVEQMSAEKNLEWDIVQSTEGGASLRDHWQGNKNLKTKELLTENTYDRIVFQDHSNFPLVHIDTTTYYFNKLKSLIPPKTKIYLYSTWMYPNIEGRENYPNLDDPIERNLREKVAAEGDQLIRVGAAFSLFSKRYTEIDLYTDDDKHPSPQGSYLAACVFFSSLSKKSSKGLKRRYSKTDLNGKKVFYSMVENKTALKCQEIADLIVFD